MVDMRQYCDNCPKKDSCSLEQKNLSRKSDYYYTRDGRKVEIVKERIKVFANISYNLQNWEQLSFFDNITQSSAAVFRGTLFLLGVFGQANKQENRRTSRLFVVQLNDAKTQLFFNHSL